MIPQINILSFFKIFRIQRLGKYIQQFHLPKDQMLILNALKYSFYYSMSFHLFACFWHIVIRDKQREIQYDSNDWEQINLSDAKALEDWYRQ